ncbi:glutamate synthase large subunit [Halorhabdus sp. CBA1104]|uniref:glutamate synthase large subunit n=1 Tax=Halorhabdus sp. CBA1104 TaxID=1380432 RepID=UPI0012B1E3DA|nr:glutamate synthase large subunit [Halorhabdus sp. CBA1104]QGN06939.1 glutamate synthase large subunit [Halorhabdus sp. CBA1104]
MSDPNASVSERGLADATAQKANCGVGVLLNLSGEKEHEIISDGLSLLENLDHRGARGAEENTGDGAGIMIQKPHGFFAEEIDGLGDFDDYGVGQVFFPKDRSTDELRATIEAAVVDEGFEVVAWRSVPTDNEGLGETALDSEPDVQQFFVRPQANLSTEELDTALYVLRNVIENRVESTEPAGHDRFYICSLDRQKLVYKGLLTNAQVRTYYEDLSDERVETSLVFVHSRFSTNTLGAWELAHPYRNIIHNGEINTLRGNLNWMQAREADLESPVFGDDIEKLKPITEEGQSDTAVLDNVLELLVEGGRSLPHALRMLVPEAWEESPTLAADREDFYQYHSTINEPWDGPALVAVTDGQNVGAILDRNGLRPCRYLVTEDDRLVMSSETGAIEVDPSRVERKDRLEPGQMFYADTEEGRIVPDDEIFDRLTDDRYGDWLEANRVTLADVDPGDVEPPSYVEEDITTYQRAFGYTLDHVERLIEPMAAEGKDPIGAMGNDTPLSVLSSRNKTLFTYFKQLFAQVSNPPIDYIREETVTSLQQHIGRQNNLLAETPEHCRQLALDSPILSRDEHAKIADIEANGIRSESVDITYDPDETDLQAAVEDVRTAAREAIEDGAEIVILSDAATGPDRVPIPSLLAVGGVHHHLVREGLRTHAGIVLESGQPNAVHHFATLVGYGADAVTPYLAYESIAELVYDGTLEVDRETALAQYRHAIEDGIQKVMAKMGISTLESYKGAQIFEAVGLDSDFVAEYFEGTENRTDGIGLEQLEADVLERHQNGFEASVAGNLELEQGGELYWRRDGEFHQWNPNTIGKLQYATNHGDYEAYQEFAGMINEQNERLQTLRGLLDFDTDHRESIPIEDVEPVEEITQRFFSSSMSFGSISPEAHETLAAGMNRVGGFASTGEGGEPTDRFGTERECADKQVASGRFGVDSNYLVNAEHLEIKMAQGSKPGEGGHLPGEKVSELIAETRSTTPGVPLISPPPHHDIYSIEDLAQLIHDLKCANRDADVHVKLVSEAGVGIIAAGVAKGKADAVLISGQSGGTGASPKTSIKNAGLPWELGIAEANQILLDNDLRSRIRVRVDGGLKTGRDVAIAALLGAEEYGFGTAPLITCGCVMLRKCHCNTCSVGVATQDEELRDNFPGDPEFVANYMRFIAREVREIMAELGVETMDELIGQTDFLQQKDVDHPRAQHVDLSELLWRPDSEDDRRKTRGQNHKLADKIDNDFIAQAQPAVKRGDDVDIEARVTNEDRTVGTMLSAELSKAHGEDGLEDDTVRLDLDGTGGQSFGAFLAPGVTIDMTGDVNDYAGKGLSGGKLIVETPAEAGYAASENILAGNVALYGATDGEAYFNGQAGERFAVRNSGVKTVVEGVGDHGCEYMTGGVAVILGETGKNFGAGMSGGEAYVLDEAGDFDQRVNHDMVHLAELDERDRQMVRRLVENHARYTDSERAEEILADWDTYVSQFVKVMPDAFAAVVEEQLEDGEDVRASPPPKPSTPSFPTEGDD